MVWTPIPASLARTIGNIFRGSLGWVAWKLFVLVVGGLLVVYAVSVTSSYLVMAMVGIVVTLALSSTVRKIVLDIWYRRFLRV